MNSSFGMKMDNEMIYKKAAIIFAVTLCLWSTNPAISEGKSTAIRSVGTQTCGNVVEVLTKKAGNEAVSALYLQWLYGFISAYNIDHKVFDAFPIRAPGNELIRFFVTLCAVNADVNFVSVVVAGIKAIEPFQAVKSDDLQSIEVEGTEYKFYKQYIKSSQLYLSTKGHLVVADGSFGAVTEAAFRKYKKENNLSGPPVPDYTFLLSMIQNKE